MTFSFSTDSWARRGGTAPLPPLNQDPAKPAAEQEAEGKEAAPAEDAK